MAMIMTNPNLTGTSLRPDRLCGLLDFRQSVGREFNLALALGADQLWACAGIIEKPCIVSLSKKPWELIERSFPSLQNFIAPLDDRFHEIAQFLALDFGLKKAALSTLAYDSNFGTLA
jgi:hypothetical protein